ncbi:MAG: hypothetical protein HQL37_02670 [Alphaproteobacteria bacterium]|nr:hypothetical protein [Alphaproteobacteria bacterium]
MNRRRFLSTTILSGVALMSPPAGAFTVQKCEEFSGTPACLELAKHKEQVAQLDNLLSQKGLDLAQRQAILRNAVCPFCGQLLLS